MGDPRASLSRDRRRFPLRRGVPATLPAPAPAQPCAPLPRAALATVVRASSCLLAYSFGAVLENPRAQLLDPPRALVPRPRPSLALPRVFPRGPVRAVEFHPLCTAVAPARHRTGRTSTVSVTAPATPAHAASFSRITRRRSSPKRSGPAASYRHARASCVASRRDGRFPGVGPGVPVCLLDSSFARLRGPLRSRGRAPCGPSRFSRSRFWHGVESVPLLPLHLPRSSACARSRAMASVISRSSSGISSGRCPLSNASIRTTVGTLSGAA